MWRSTTSTCEAGAWPPDPGHITSLGSACPSRTRAHHVSQMQAPTRKRAIPACAGPVHCMRRASAGACVFSHVHQWCPSLNFSCRDYYHLIWVSTMFETFLQSMDLAMTIRIYGVGVANKIWDSEEISKGEREPGKSTASPFPPPHLSLL